MLPIVLTIIGELPAALSLAKQLKDIFSKDGSNVIVQVQELQVKALSSAEETLRLIAESEAAHHGA